ncbi:hypothetical protein BV25DRAFT_1413287 [Artomyces pyxidatus]|uniref:Uncharacterized protein n=1 Tax=Artomyces pyxidatus TaxID=48021 RepID=A0ACB8TDZ0_9AGAM|nr:hypothetical protein BV25DRAFT_1413287 [Artomyces pyxidatus]
MAGCEVWNTFPKMVETLATMKQLKVLSIGPDILPPASESTTESTVAQRLRLARLQVLLLAGNGRQIHQTMRLLSVPHQADITLSYHSHSEPGLSADIATILAHHLALPLATRRSFDKIEFHQLSWHLAQHMIMKPRGCHPRGPGPLTITFNPCSDTDYGAINVAGRVLTHSLTRALVMPARRLMAQHYSLSSPFMWININGTIPRLREIDVQGSCLYGLLDNVYFPPLGLSRASLFPALRTLIVRDVDFVSTSNAQFTATRLRNVLLAWIYRDPTRRFELILVNCDIAEF